ncbi:MAG TPA: DUF4340 domain-containing protein [Desulfosalsimonadaceae bacterium]|nr:DUF4340 domain-containing protein [Desulfosalsimonadaceae bacterium]
MKAKKEYLILFAVALVLVLYLLLHQSGRTLYELPKLQELKKAQITKITVSGPDTRVRLEKAGDKWKLMPEGYPAESSRVENMTDIISSLTLTAMVSEAQNYSRYHLGEAKRIGVKAWAGQELLRSFAVGKPAPSRRHTFVKLADDPRIYHARKNFRSRFTGGAGALRDKTVLAVDADTVRAIEIRHKDAKLRLERRQQAPSKKGLQGKTQQQFIWEDKQGDEIAASKIEKLLKQLKSLDCQSFIDKREKPEFTNPIYTLAVDGKKSRTLSIFARKKADADMYPAVSSEAADPFYLSAAKAEAIMEAIGKE